MSARRNPADSAQQETTSTTTPEMQEQIRNRAYEIYEQRGRQDGSAEQDWFQAEAEILGIAKTPFKAAA